MLKKIKEYIEDNEFRLTLFSDRMYLVNYVDILSLEEERISILTKNEKIIVKGKKLSLNKLLQEEVLISGIIESIEVFKR